MIDDRYPIDFTRLTPIDRMVGEDSEETSLLQEMHEESLSYIRNFAWCQPIVDQYFAFGVGGVVALFLFRFRPPVNNSEEALWVVVGDLPSAFLVVDQAPDRRSALEMYCVLMQGWADAVLNGAGVDHVFPVAAPATAENARMLLSRVDFIRNRLLPEITE